MLSDPRVETLCRGEAWTLPGVTSVLTDELLRPALEVGLNVEERAPGRDVSRPMA